MVTQEQINQSKQLHTTNIKSAESDKHQREMSLKVNHLPLLDKKDSIIDDFNTLEFLSLVFKYYGWMMIGLWGPIYVAMWIVSLFGDNKPNGHYHYYYHGVKNGYVHE